MLGEENVSRLLTRAKALGKVEEIGAICVV